MAALFCSALLALLAVFSHGAVIDSGDTTFTTNSPIVMSERELRRAIFSNYDKSARPVKRNSNAVTVSISLSPLSITSMSEKNQVLEMETWVMMKWTDEYLQWDPSNYDNITELRVPPSEIWKPDISLYTAMSDVSFFPKAQTNAIVFNYGMVLWVPPFSLRSRCSIPFRSYVIAERTFVDCNIKFGSWTYSGKQLDLQLATEKVDLTNFQDFNREWKLVEIVSERGSKTYPCCVDEYPYVNFNVTMKKRNYYLNSDN